MWRHLLILTLATLACSSGTTKSSSDAGTDRGVGPADAGRAGDLIADRRATDAGAGDAAVDGPATCWPACLANLWAACPRPATGTCMSQDGRSCYPNGVVETATTGDGGVLTFVSTKPDGHTLCETSIYDPLTMILTYYDANNSVVATILYLATSASYEDLVVSCDGRQVSVSASQQQSPACKTLRDSDCIAGTCP